MEQGEGNDKLVLKHSLKNTLFLFYMWYLTVVEIVAICVEQFCCITFCSTDVGVMKRRWPSLLVEEWVVHMYVDLLRVWHKYKKGKDNSFDSVFYRKSSLSTVAIYIKSSSPCDYNN